MAQERGPLPVERVTRRLFLKTTVTTAAALILTACAPAAPTATPKPAAPPKPATAVPPPVAATAPAATPKPATKPGFIRAPEPNPKRGGTLKGGWGVTTPHFDLHQGGNSNTIGHLYNNLVRKDPTDGLRTIIPELAESWEISSDGKTYTFKLRDGVKFHDGVALTTDDVVANFTRIINPPEGIAITIRENFVSVGKVEAVDKLTVRFTLKQPDPTLMEVLCDPAVVIYSKKSLEENKNDLRKVIAPGTGAFIFKEHKVAERWVFERNPNYWDPQLPYIDRLELYHVPSMTDRGTAVLTGQTDLSWNVAVDTYNEGLKRKDIVSAGLIPNLRAHAVHIHNEKKPFTDPRVRRAIHLAVSRQNLYKAFQTIEPIYLTRWMAYASPFATPLEQIQKMPGYREDKSEDIAAAKKLMADAGYPNGFDGVELVTASVGMFADVLAPAFQAELKQTLNISAKIRLMERGLLTEEYKKGNFDMLLETAFHSPTVDPGPGWALYFRKGASQNWSRYSNPKMDEILDKIAVEMDKEKRKKLFSDGMDLLDQDVPLYLTGFTAHAPMWRNYVKGLNPDKRIYSEWGRIETVWLDK